VAALRSAFADGELEAKYGVRIVQAWGMTETSPLAAVAHPPASVEVGSTEEMDWRARTGRVVRGVELRIVDDAGQIPAVGRRGGRRDRGARSVDHGLLLPRSVPREVRRRAGCAPATSAACRRGYIQITDRAKDVIKSGGEWISSVELENLLMGHPDVLEASVHRVPDPPLGRASARLRGAHGGSAVDAARSPRTWAST